MTLKARIARLEGTSRPVEDLLLTDIGLIRVLIGTGKFEATGTYDACHPRNPDGTPMTPAHLRDYLAAHDALTPDKAELLDGVITDSEPGLRRRIRRD